jgi:hypothetical protein
MIYSILFIRKCLGPITQIMYSGYNCGMASNNIEALIAKWTADGEGYRSESRRLELVDRSRHSTTIAMLEASAEAIDRCISELEAVLDTRRSQTY